LGEAVDLVSLFPDETSGSGAAGAAATSSKGVNFADPDNVSSVDIHIVRSGARLRGFAKIDENFLKPFFTRKFTDEVWNNFFFVLYMNIYLLIAN
jgi:hypothetical protein